MKSRTLIKYLKEQVRRDNHRAKFTIGDGVRIKKNLKLIQYGDYKEYEDDEELKRVLLVGYDKKMINKLKDKKLTVVAISSFEFITRKSNICYNYRLSDGFKHYSLYEEALVKIK